LRAARRAAYASVRHTECCHAVGAEYAATAVVAKACTLGITPQQGRVAAGRYAGATPMAISSATPVYFVADLFSSSLLFTSQFDFLLLHRRDLRHAVAVSKVFYLFISFIFAERFADTLDSFRRHCCHAAMPFSLFSCRGCGKRF
jgi:hypothetical protein